MRVGLGRLSGASVLVGLESLSGYNIVGFLAGGNWQGTWLKSPYPLAKLVEQWHRDPKMEPKNVVERARYYFMKHRTAFHGKAVSKKKKEDKHVLPLFFHAVFHVAFYWCMFMETFPWHDA